MTLKKTLVLTVGTLMLVALVFAARLVGVDDLFYSVNFLAPSATVTDSVVVVGIDAKSVETVGGWPWSRSTLARLFDRIDAGNPRAVALDFLFPPRPDDSLGNDSMSRVFSRMPSLVLPFRLGSFGAAPEANAVQPDVFRHRFKVVTNPELLDNTTFFSGGDVTLPDSLFARYARYGGYLNVTTAKTSQKLREIIHVMKIGEEYYPSFGLSAVAAYLALEPAQFKLDGAGAVELGGRRLPFTNYAASTFVNFRGRPGTVRTIPAGEILAGSVDPATFRGRLVFVGITEPGIVADFLVTPVGSNYPGVEAWATCAMDMIDGTWIRYGGGFLGIVNWLLVLGLFPGLAILLGRRKWTILGTGVGIVVVSFVATVILFRTGNYFWNPTGHMLAWVFSLFWLAAQKVDPSLAGPRALEFDPPEENRDARLPSPVTGSKLTEIPNTDTARYVAEQIRTTLPPPPAGLLTANHTMVETSVAAIAAADSDVVERLRNLSQGEIVRTLGSGGMADVYLVWNPRMEVYRAVKVLKPGQPERILSRFETEIRIIANLSHPNIVQCYSVGEWYGLPFLDMEFINGASLEDVLSKVDKLTVSETLAVGILVCRALQYAHGNVITLYGTTYNGVIHRDLKPANIMLSRGGRVKLADFGIARPTEVSLHTGEATTIVGTLPYLAPEQAEGKEVTLRADIYALGATLYELLCGRRAFPHSQVTSLLTAKALGQIEPLSAAAVPASVSSAVKKAMAQSPDNRYASAAALSADLEDAFRAVTQESGYAVLDGLTRRFWGSVS